MPLPYTHRTIADIHFLGTQKKDTVVFPSGTPLRLATTEERDAWLAAHEPGYDDPRMFQAVVFKGHEPTVRMVGPELIRLNVTAAYYNPPKERAEVKPPSQRHVLSAMVKFSSRQPGASVTLTDDEVCALVGEITMCEDLLRECAPRIVDSGVDDDLKSRIKLALRPLDNYRERP